MNYLYEKAGGKISYRGVRFGGKKIVFIAGPCALESEEQAIAAAEIIKKASVKIFRAPIFKPRTSPYSFQGIGTKGLNILEKIADSYRLLTAVEVMDVNQIAELENMVDILWVGARNMQNYSLLKALGKTRNLVLLKNSLCSTIEEFLLSAEYILKEGNSNLLLCVRGLRSFDSVARFPLQIEWIPALKQRTKLPICTDVSHSAGDVSIVPFNAKAAIAAGTDSIMVEVHPWPEKALSDANQQLNEEQFLSMMKELRKIANAVGRCID
ncbi:MAG: 3-deoxy-7-phosphoheptulonate synthase [Candidatus Diapherotrites archaeon]|nr:3-deoxy-7-phosphoheptulonate synthase [Candidatus Diapherotrites archaeon]